MRLKQRNEVETVIGNGNSDPQWRHRTSDITKTNEEAQLALTDNGYPTKSHSLRDDCACKTAGDINDLSNTVTETIGRTGSQSSQDQKVCNNKYREELVEKAYSRNQIVNAERTQNVLSSNNAKDNFTDRDASPCLEEAPMLEHSDTDEASESGNSLPVPRGIVNPNYPGFQHLAHTLQDYSETIENFYHYENEMTDDDLDVDVTDLSFDNKEDSIDSDFNSNNNIEDSEKYTEKTKVASNTFATTEEKSLDVIFKNYNRDKNIEDIPDLLKNISTGKECESENNNTFHESKNFSCEIENNFKVSDIIGDFNKEVEDEISNLLNYSLNIQNDLIHLRRDIEESFKKPIEETIDHISEVVNRVIKPLVIEHQEIVQSQIEYISNNNLNKSDEIVFPNWNKQKIVKQMNYKRPTFLWIENADSSKMSDAFLSDARDQLMLSDTDYVNEKFGALPRDEDKFESVDHKLRKLTPKTEIHTSNIAEQSTDGNYNGIAEKNYTDDKKLDANLIDNAKEISAEKNAKNDRGGIQSRENKCGGAQKWDKPEGKKSVPGKRKSEDKTRESFDVYNIETAMPKLDFDAIESHLRAAEDAERRKRNDREEIRRRLAMGANDDDLPSDRPGRKPSLHSRLQSVPWKLRPSSTGLKPSKSRSSQSLGHVPLKESDFHALQATLQTEARIALAQAKEMARIHMERERRCRAASPVTDMLRRSLDKASCPLAPDRRRVSRQILTDMNIAQLQVIVNSLHCEVERLSETLVQLLMERDELHMGQDSMLVDIEDLTRYLGVKEQNNKNGARSGVRRLTSLVHKQNK